MDNDNDRCYWCKIELVEPCFRYSVKKGNEHWLDTAAQDILCSSDCLRQYAEDEYWLEQNG